MTRPDPELVERITAAVFARGGKREGDELRFHCPEPHQHANGDAHPSARWNPTKAVWCCDVCTADGGALDLARRLGLEIVGRRARRVLGGDLDGFARQRALPRSVLDRFTVRAAIYAQRPALRYPTALGIDRVKYTDGARPKYTWATRGGHAHWYGLDTAVSLLRRERGSLFLVNGEPSVWACTARDVAAVCLCGERVTITADLVSVLRDALSEIEPVPLRVVFDLDPAGRQGAQAAVAALRLAGWEDVCALDLSMALPDRSGADVDDLHRQVGQNLATALRGLPVLDDTSTSPREENRGLVKTDAKVSQATQLLELAEDLELFHTPDADPAAYCRVAIVDAHHEVYRIPSRPLRALLRRRFYRTHRSAVRGQSLAEALGVLEAQALEGEPHAVATRLAARDGVIYLDLCDAAWRVVEVSAHGWRVVSDAPVRFRRTRGMLSLPEPIPGGHLEALRAFVNVADDDAWRLIVAWLLAALRPHGPFPVLALHGEQGAAKSTATRVLRVLVDPNVAALRAEPREPRDLMIAATNGWIIAIDNMSHVPTWLSDALCRLSTGGGFATRELYSDAEEVLFDATRPVVVNGIEELCLRGDLADRAVIATLPAVTDEHRQTEAEFWRAFEAAHPALLGALLDVVVGGLRDLPNTRLDKVPRMADFAVWVTACEAGLGWESGAFLRSYAGARRAATEATLEASAVASALLGFMANREDWTGTAAELLTALEAEVPDTLRRDRQRWPQSPRGLAGALRRLASALRAAGFQVDPAARIGHDRRREIAIRRSEGKDRPHRPHRPHAPIYRNFPSSDADGRGRSPDQPSAEKPSVFTPADDADGADGLFPTLDGWGEL